MKKQILIISIFLVTAAIVGFHPAFDKQVNAKPNDPIVTTSSKDHPRIQMAILLDTSNSMDGLINQTREQLWQVVNEFAKTKKDGKTPLLEVAIYEYGNSSLAEKDGFVRQVLPLTSELDAVSEALFSLTTNGGDEYCGYVIRDAVKGLKWSNNDSDIKTIFIAGNEPFTQGPVPFQEAIGTAKKKGITVNTILAGAENARNDYGWREGALLAGGEFMSIEHNHKIVHMNAPQDDKLVRLGDKLNNTYVPYGAQGRRKARRQLEQDQRSKAVSQSFYAKRSAAKGSGMYRNSDWDLLDAFEEDATVAKKMKPAQLPKEMRKMDEKERVEYLKKKQAERAKLKQEISKLNEERAMWLAKEKAKKSGLQANTVENALVGAIRKEAKKKNYEVKTK